MDHLAVDVMGKLDKRNIFLTCDLDACKRLCLINWNWMIIALGGISLALWV